MRQQRGEAAVCDLRRKQTEGNGLQPQINTDLRMKNLKHMADMKNAHQRHSYKLRLERFPSNHPQKTSCTLKLTSAASFPAAHERNAACCTLIIHSKVWHKRNKRWSFSCFYSTTWRQFSFLPPSSRGLWITTAAPNSLNSSPTISSNITPSKILLTSSTLHLPLRLFSFAKSSLKVSKWLFPVE